MVVEGYDRSVTFYWTGKKQFRIRKKRREAVLIQ